eukprot:TRINITY_DN3281_c0_g2_i2.p1 TRINITY_DN3281_c0_g2~~TRINITY_DN3281_c0_g2_i2.p1  ORF type:complete len:587 (-),score=170.81 TRINITY_DN3281_c0_g2_i2:83-1843(-)
MIQQTRTALIYSDLALFLVDTKAGIKEDDLLLSEWLHTRMKLGRNVGVAVEEVPKTLEERKKEFDRIVEEGREAIPGSNLIRMSKKKLTRKFRELERKSKQIRNLLLVENEDDVKVPTVLLVANKTEDGFKGDIEETYDQLSLGEPILISGEHGDGIVDLFRAIKREMPEDYKRNWEERMEKRKKRQEEYKKLITAEIYSMLQEKEGGDSNQNAFDAKEWEKEFDKRNVPAEYNSDYDSDSEVNPVQRLYIPETPGARRKVVSENPMKRRKIQLSIVGKMNVGKSTLINSLLQEHRVIAADIPGTTRDAVSIEWEYKGRRITLVDTAGIKPPVKRQTPLEVKVQEDVEKAIDFSHVIALVIDAQNCLRPQDMDIIRRIFDEGKALVLVANKWDLVPEKMKARIKQRIESIQLSHGSDSLKSTIVVYTSGLTGYNVKGIMNAVLKAYNKWNTRVSTSLLNKWLEELKRVHKMPTEGKRTLRPRYMMQIASRPPTFYFFVNNGRLCPENFERFIANSLTREYRLRGVPIRILIRDRAGEVKSNSSTASIATIKVRERIRNYRAMLRNPTRRRRVVGSKKLYGTKGRLI